MIILWSNKYEAAEIVQSVPAELSVVLAWVAVMFVETMAMNEDFQYTATKLHVTTWALLHCFKTRINSNFVQKVRENSIR
jgi:hypothetical protein